MQAEQRDLRTKPANALTLDFQPPEPERINFCRLHHTLCGFVMAALGKDHTKYRWEYEEWEVSGWGENWKLHFEKGLAITYRNQIPS